MATTPNSTIRIAAIGDIHVSKSSQGKFQPLFAQITSSADVLVLCGDFTDYGLPDEARILARELTASVKIPVIAVLGNHDYEAGKHIEIRELPNEARGMWGVGTMHHVAWRVADEAVELRARERIAAAHRRPTEVIDRFWFKSVYFLEPGGVLFELATDGPGFTADEPLEHLGEQLVLPPWLEPNRREIEAALPPLAPVAPVSR